MSKTFKIRDLVKENVLKLTPYQAGTPIDEIKRRLGLKKVIKLASNENPLGPSPKAVAAIEKALNNLNRYPDSQGFYLKERLGRRHNLESCNIILGNGSDEIIDLIIKTFLKDGEEALTSKTTFLEYQIQVRSNAKKIKLVPLKGFKYDLEAMLRAVNKKTKLVFIANPNNPTGTYVNEEELKRFIFRLPKKVILILDEAYDIFVQARDFPKSIDLIDKRNLIILRTFSKAYGLAGLRIGYGIADKKAISYMERVRQPFNVNCLAQAGAEAALSDGDFLRRTQRLIWKEKQFLYQQFKRLKIDYIPSEANFILFAVKRDCERFFKEMLKKGVIVRDMKQYGLSNYIRLSIGTRRENNAFIEALKEVSR